MSLRDDLVEQTGVDELLFLDPASQFDFFIMGIREEFGQEPAVIYDKQGILDSFVKDGMTEEEALEYFEFNTIGSYVGPTPHAFFTPLIR